MRFSGNRKGTQIGEIARKRDLGYKGDGSLMWWPCVVCNESRWVSFQVDGDGVKQVRPGQERCLKCARKDIAQRHHDRLQAVSTKPVQEQPVDETEQGMPDSRLDPVLFATSILEEYAKMRNRYKEIKAEVIELKVQIEAAKAKLREKRTMSASTINNFDKALEQILEAK